MKKRVLPILALFCALLLCACGGKKDPSSSEPTKEPSENSVQTDHALTDEELHALSEKEALEKYGCGVPYAGACLHDDRYRYSVSSFNYNGGTRTASTVHRSSLRGRNGPEPVCSDPNCRHTPGSGCVFANVESCLCAGEDLYFITHEYNGDGNALYTLYRYVKEDNTRQKIDESCTKINAYSVSGKLYFSKAAEDDPLCDSYEYYAVSKNGAARRFAVIDGAYRGIPYDEHKLIHQTQSAGWHYLCLYDVDSCEDTVIDRSRQSVYVFWGLFGSKLQTYNADTATWFFVDLETLEKITIDESDGFSLCSWTDRCLILKNKRTKQSDPYILRFFWPLTGETEEYDLNALSGGQLDLSVKIAFRLDSALLYKQEADGKRHYFLEIDLPSGGTRLLDAEGYPDESEPFITLK